MSLADFNQNSSSQDEMEQVDSYLSKSEDENTLKDKLSEKDPIEIFGAFMGGFVSPPVLLAPSDAPDMNEFLSNNLPLGEHESEVHDFMEDVYDFKDEYLIGYPRNAENPISKVTLNVDKVGHYSVGYLAGGMAARGVDKVTEEYDPKKIALGGALAVATYAIAKEGAYEGGSGIQFDLDNMDVWGDWTMDTLGMTHSIYNFHKRKTAENGEEPEGVLSEIANKAGRAYEKARSDVNPQGKSFKFNNGTSKTGYLTGKNEVETGSYTDSEESSLTEVLGKYLSEFGGGNTRYVNNQGGYDDLPEPDYINLDDI